MGVNHKLDALDPHWLEWLCKAVLHGASEQELKALLFKQGDPNPSDTLSLLKSNPIFNWAVKEIRQQQHTAQRAESYVQLQSALWETLECKLPRISAPTPEYFFSSFYGNARPVIITDWASTWPACTRWSPSQWAERFAGISIEICANRDQDPLYDRHFTELAIKTDLGEFARSITKIDSSNDRYLIARNFAFNHPELTSLLDDIKEEPYLNPQARSGSIALWLGPAGTYTPLHHDTCQIMFVQIYGEKHFSLIPAHVQELFDQASNMYSNLPSTRDLRQDPAHPQQLDMTLSAGEALFIPVGWWHAVRSLSPSISLAMTHFKYANHFSWYQPNAR